MVPLRRWAKSVLLRVGRHTVMPSPFPRVIVLCYHSVHPRSSDASTTPELFDRHLAWLKEHCDIIPFRRVLESTHRKTNRPMVSVTFDDGFADNYEYAFPLLRRYGVHATFFLTAGFLEKDPTVLERFQTLWRRRADSKWPAPYQQQFLA